MKFLQGKKTYIVAVLMAIVTVLYNLGQIDKSMYDMLMALLSAGAVSTVAAKVNRIQQTSENK